MIETDYGMEVNATRGCTNSCASCNHGSTKFTESYFMEPETLKRDLDMMRDKLHVKLFMVQGGEPLLHPKVTELLKLISDSGMSHQYGVLTNGKLLPRMKDDFWECLGERKMELRMSCYPDLSPDVVPLAEAKAAKYGFSVRPQQINVFQTIFLKNDGSTYYGCGWNRCLTIHEGYFYLCPLTAFFPKQFMGLPETTDGIPIEGMTEERLQTFLNRKEPLETCKICAGTRRGKQVDWHQSKSWDEWKQTAGMDWQ